MGNLIWKNEAQNLLENFENFNISEETIVKNNLIQKIIHNGFNQLNWQDFIQKFMIDELFGVSFDWEKVQISSQFNQLIEIVENLPFLNENHEIDTVIMNLPTIDINLLQDNYQIIKVLSYLLMISNSYLFHQFPSNVPQKLPKIIAVPLYQLASKLNIKAALGWAQNLCNWKFIDKENKSDDLNNLQVRYSFTGTDDEQIFYLISTLADFKMAKIIKIVFQVNQFIISNLQNTFQRLMNKQNQKENEVINFQFCSVQEIIQKENESVQKIKSFLKQFKEDEIIESFFVESLIKMANIMDEITASLKQMYSRNRSNYFYSNIRNYLQGYANKQVFPNGLLFEGVDVRLEYEGGSGGNSPSFQIYERALGIHFDGELQDIQNSMRQGMIQQHIELIQFLNQHSFLRSYALISNKKSVKDAYNKAIQSYIQFNSKHLYYIEHYIIQQMIKRNPQADFSQTQGTGNAKLETIKQRYLKFEVFLIK